MVRVGGEVIRWKLFSTDMGRGLVFNISSGNKKSSYEGNSIYDQYVNSPLGIRTQKKKKKKTKTETEEMFTVYILPKTPKFQAQNPSEIYRDK